MHRVALTPPAVRAIAAHASSAFPEEGCGLLIGAVDADGTASVGRIVRCRNEAPARERPRRFVIDPRAVIRARALADGTVLGFYHSHPDGTSTPSRLDVAHMRLWPGTVWLIVAAEEGGSAASRCWYLDSCDDLTPRELELVGLPRHTPLPAMA